MGRGGREGKGSLNVQMKGDEGDGKRMKGNDDEGKKWGNGEVRSRKEKGRKKRERGIKV